MNNPMSVYPCRAQQTFQRGLDRECFQLHDPQVPVTCSALHFILLFNNPLKTEP